MDDLTERARAAAERYGVSTLKDRLIAEIVSIAQSEREAAAAEARRAAIEECALLLKGRVYKTRYREYPALGGDGNWSGDSAFVRHCDKFAEAILALASPAPQEETGSVGHEQQKHID